MAARGGEPCPDPSAHGKTSRLSEQASTAALYVTDPSHRNTPSPSSKPNPLGADGKLSSASAAASLKYARPEDLPSFPSTGLASNSASRAALQAQGVKAKEYEVPEASSAGSRAALLAHRKGPELNLWQPASSKDGNSAAILALRAKGLSPDLDRGYTDEGKHKALLAATKSIHSGSGSEPRSTPSPNLYPDQHNSAHNALNAATVSHRASVRSPEGWESDANQAARIRNLHGLSPDMWGEHPPVEIEQDEAKRQSALRASAVSMAKQMYDYQNRSTLEPTFTGGKAGADAAAARKQPDEQLDVKAEALRYIHLQDAASKLAQERLAKVDKNFEAAKYREYYGYPDAQPSHRKSIRTSMRGRNRKRAGSESNAGDDDSDDEEQAQRIRNQMSQLNSGLSSIDEKKRADDRAKLMAAAQKKVQGRMSTMDKNVFDQTGKIPPSILEEWEKKARERAEAEREMANRPENKGKTHIGGGVFIDQSELDAIAEKRLRPTMDEINDTAEKRRAHDEEMRKKADEEHTKKMEEKMEKQRQKEEWRAVREQDKQTKREAKEEERKRKLEEERRKQEEMRLAAEARAPATGDAEAQPDPKRQSMRGRVKSLLMGGKQQRPAEAEDKNDGTAAGAAVAGGGAAAPGVAAGEAGDEEKPDEANKEMEDREAKEQKELDQENAEKSADVDPSTEKAEASGASDGEDAGEGGKLRPNLERHITHELESSSSDDEWGSDADDDVDGDSKAKDDEQLANKGKDMVATKDAENTDQGESGDLGKDEAHRVAERVGTAPVADDAVHKTSYEKNETLPEKAEVETPGPAAAPQEKETGDKAEASKPGDDKETAGSPPKETKEHKEAMEASKKVMNENAGNEKEKKGLRGFFKKLRHRESKSENEIRPKSSEAPKKSTPEAKPAAAEAKPVSTEAPKESSSEAKPAAEEPTQKASDAQQTSEAKPDTSKAAETEPAKNGSVSSEVAGTSAAGAGVGAATVEQGKGSTDTEMPASTQPSGSEPKVSPLNSDDNRSESSFRRHEGDLRDVDDVSSSGAEEDDLTRGRGGSGSGARVLGNGERSEPAGKKSGEGNAPKMSLDRADGEDDDDQFYESTDHFDSSTLAPPTFTASKSESPSRATKFKEDV
ncbi:hypothetical protein KC332_g1058 [Hortaea werneckii]|uniref:Eisosome protein 1 n=2 Tax=Hortaea werneckii TaxID=91943 RepID=A0A3M7JBI1_HORWE|nr:hypothetical protein KC358_g850 [Hortaea werneckii]OTA32763.1 hypothetical protein BTJ68_06521 [Hortaea werneckii EXF-2000]KAI6852366.1 hypothetical protein KC350_g966 [Hortaea werneckii]KAI6944240.1 hypothetical protein KC341_g969 [Hortaea werneckii]KAI6949983.1 hypothetical protein KC348_g958 [Hortaea werneckii]